MLIKYLFNSDIISYATVRNYPQESHIGSDESMVKKEDIACDKCGKSFDSKIQMDQHKNDVHSKMKETKVTKKVVPRKSFCPSKKYIIVISIGVLIAITAGLITSYATLPKSSSESESKRSSALAINGIQCNTEEQLLFHRHAHLDIFVNGSHTYIPPQIGVIPDRCIYWLHTHDETGMIHIESPVQRDFTLGQFFDMWRSKLANSSAFVNTLEKNTPTVYINGSKQSDGINYKSVKLNAHDEITLVYGIPPASIPSRYDFPKGQ
jgi:hypothetical protein